MQKRFYWHKFPDEKPGINDEQYLVKTSFYKGYYIDFWREGEWSNNTEVISWCEIPPYDLPSNESKIPVS